MWSSMPSSDWAWFFVNSMGFVGESGGGDGRVGTNVAGCAVIFGRAKVEISADGSHSFIV